MDQTDLGYRLPGASVFSTLGTGYDSGISSTNTRIYY